VADAYTTASALVAYRFSDRYRVALNVDNLFDEKYYEKISNAARQNFYGAPRSATVTFRTQF
jgi:outer-membrane receptor for ferric coprogen and ferric-rhodotorulic acid